MRVRMRVRVRVRVRVHVRVRARVRVCVRVRVCFPVGRSPQMGLGHLLWQAGVSYMFTFGPGLGRQRI